jgi:hypothetical protein
VIGEMIVPSRTLGEVRCFTQYEPSFAAPGIAGNRLVRYRRSDVGAWLRANAIGSLAS